jgi:hypothetical protein
MNMNSLLPLRHPTLRVSGLGLGLAAALLLLPAASVTAASGSTNSPSRPEFSTFKLILERNIFDPRRSPRYVPRDRSARQRSFRSDYVALVGIMNYDAQGPIAFFDGSSSQYQKVLKPSDNIAGYKITKIEPDSVRLAVGTNEFQMPLGMQLQRDSDGKWQLTERTEPPPERTERSERSYFTRGGPQPMPSRFPQSFPQAFPTTNGDTQVFNPDAEPPPMPLDQQADAGGPPPPPDAVPTNGETDPVLLRMMQRRAQQGGQ